MVFQGQKGLENDRLGFWDIVFYVKGLEDFELFYLMSDFGGSEVGNLAGKGPVGFWSVFGEEFEGFKG